MSSSKKKATPFAALDEDLCSEIFKRLPIKTLSRFRCVCKWFNSLISSALFIDLHFSFARSATPPRLKPYLHLEPYRRGNPVELRFPDPGLDDAVEHSKQPLYFPFHADPKNIVTFLDVIHGVVCFSSNRSSGFSVFLWNPAIHKYLALSLSMPDRQYSLAFGYDASTKDFKLVVLVRTSHWTYTVYSARQGSWSGSRGVKLNSSWSFNKDSKSCFVNGAIHWVLSLSYEHKGRNLHSSNHSVLMFDCEREEFRRMTIPSKLHSMSKTRGVKLMEYAGMLAALVEVSYYDLCVWVMEEHGVATSWKKLCRIPYLEGIVIYDPSFEKLAPYGPGNSWNKLTRGGTSYSSREILSEHVYDETMHLMDHPKARSYTNKEVVPILD